jgi:hypothetical protein
MRGMFASRLRGFRKSLNLQQIARRPQASILERLKDRFELLDLEDTLTAWRMKASTACG